MKITYRKATPGDAPALKEISRRVIRTNYTPFLGGEMVDDFIKSGSADSEIDDGINTCTVMLDEAVIIGFAIAYGDLLHLIMVDVPHQGKGHGSALLLKIESQLFETCDSIRLQTFEENVNTVQFYLKNKWVVTGSQPVPEMGKTMLFLSKAKDSG